MLDEASSVEADDRFLGKNAELTCTNDSAIETNDSAIEKQE